MRILSHSVGSIVFHIAPDGLTGGAVAGAIDAHFGPKIRSHLHADGRPSQVGQPPRCLRRRAEILSDPPLISVIVATKERPATLARCLDSLMLVEYPRVEIVVVDNDPATGETAELVAKKYAPHGVGYVCERWRGLAAAHNRGVQMASKLLAVTDDDDVVVDRHWVTALAETFVVNDGVGAVTGLIEPGELRTATQLLLERHGAFAKGCEPNIFDLDTHRPEEPRFPLAAGQFGSGANMAFNRKCLQRLGGFNPVLGTGTRTRGRDDLAAFFAAVTAGYRIVYQPDALAALASRQRGRACPAGVRVRRGPGRLRDRRAGARAGNSAQDGAVVDPAGDRRAPAATGRLVTGADQARAPRNDRWAVRVCSELVAGPRGKTTGVVVVSTAALDASPPSMLPRGPTGGAAGAGPRGSYNSSVAVVICAYTEDRWRLHVRAVRSAAGQTRPPAALVVVIVVVVELAALAALAGVDPWPASRRLTIVANSGRRGLADSRNTGIAAVIADVVALLDDDDAEAEWLERLCKHYDDPHVVGVDGRVVPEWASGRPGWFPPEFDGVVGCSYRALPVDAAPVRNPIGANMSFRRDVVVEIGGSSRGLGELARSRGRLPVSQSCGQSGWRSPRWIPTWDLVGCRDSERLVGSGNALASGDPTHHPRARSSVRRLRDRSAFHLKVLRHFIQSTRHHVATPARPRGDPPAFVTNTAVWAARNRRRTQTASKILGAVSLGIIGAVRRCFR